MKQGDAVKIKGHRGALWRFIREIDDQTVEVVGPVGGRKMPITRVFSKELVITTNLPPGRVAQDHRIIELNHQAHSQRRK